MNRQFISSQCSSLQAHCRLLKNNRKNGINSLFCLSQQVMIRDFSVNRYSMEKKRTLWGNIMEFVNTVKAGRKMKKVEDEMKENYTRLVANTLLETIRDQKQMKQDVDKQFSEMYTKMNENMKDIKKDMNVDKMKKDLEKKYGNDMNSVIKNMVEDKLTLNKDFDSTEELKNIEKEMSSILGNNSNTATPKPTTSATSSTTAGQSKFKQMIEKQKQSKK